MRMDIKNSPGAQAGGYGPAARDSMSQRRVGGGAMCGNCLCCMKLRDPCRERRVATLLCEHGNGVLWHHAASTLNAASYAERPVVPNIETTTAVSIAPASPQLPERPKKSQEPALGACPSLA
jgi:hypothetical protein